MTAQDKRCPWCLGSPEYMAYHGREWGRPVHDDRVFFEFPTLEGAQAVREAFGSFDAYVWRFVDGAPKRNRPRTAAKEAA